MTRPTRPSRSAFTLVEILVTIALTAMLMLLVTQLFVVVNKSIRNSRATLEMSDRHRAVVSRLRLDLQGATADLVPPGRPEKGKGYFEYVEGPIGTPVAPLVDDPALKLRSVARQTDQTDPAGNDPYAPDTSAADADDILMLTVRSRGEPFTGRTFVKLVRTKTPPDGTDPVAFDIERTAQSPLAEVIWFVRGTTLYRRVLLVLPEHDVDQRVAGIQPLTYPYLYGTGRPAEGHLAAVTQRDVDRSPSLPEHAGFYNNFDLSARFEYNEAAPLDTTQWRWVPNTLADLTRRECRYAHQPSISPRVSSPVPFWRLFPFNPQSAVERVSGNAVQFGDSDWRYLRLPTLGESSHADWVAGRSLPYLLLSPDDTFLDEQGKRPSKVNFRYDPWVNPLPYAAAQFTFPGGSRVNTTLDPQTGNLVALAGPRAGEDVILTNVIGFDVKAWDPTAPIVMDNAGTNALVPGDPGYRAALAREMAKQVQDRVFVGYGGYVDLGYWPLAAGVPPLSEFSHNGHIKSSLLPRVYDTWSSLYEHDGLDQNGNGLIDEGADGFDNDGLNGVDDAGERETMPPYPVPLRGIQIKIRVFEPDTGQIRELTIVHDFLPQ